jgi:hypothetical protein
MITPMQLRAMMAKQRTDFAPVSDGRLFRSTWDALVAIGAFALTVFLAFAGWYAWHG